MHNPSTPSDDHSDEQYPYGGQTDLFVYCGTCGKKKPDEIIFENIEEAFFGGDVLTFTCMECNEVRTSYVLRE